MVFALPSLEKVRDMGNSDNEKEDLEVSLYFLNYYETLLCTTAILQTAPPQVILFVVISFPLLRYNRLTVYSSINLYPLDFLWILQLMGFNGWYRSYRNKWVERFLVNCFSKDKSWWGNAARGEIGAKKGGERNMPTVKWAVSPASISSAQLHGAPALKGGGAVHGTWYWERSHLYSCLFSYLQFMGRMQDPRTQNHRYWVKLYIILSGWLVV